MKYRLFLGGQNILINKYKKVLTSYNLYDILYMRGGVCLFLER